MAFTHVKTVTVSPADDLYNWSVIDDATAATASWITVTAQTDANGEDTDDWDFLVADNTGSARSATATVTHSNGVTTDSFTIDQAGVSGTTTQAPATTTQAPATTQAPVASYDSIGNNMNPVQEGYTITFTVSTTNVPVGTIPTYQLFPVSGTFDANDIVGGSLTGNMSAIDANGEATVDITIAQDQTAEGQESYTFRVTGDNAGTPSSAFPLISSTRDILDTSTGAPAWNSIVVKTLAGTTVTNTTGGNEGWTLTGVLTGDSRPLGETLYWQMDFTSYTGVLGQSPASANDFTSTSGSFTMGQTHATFNPTGDSNVGYFQWDAVTDAFVEGKEGYGVRVYTDAGFTNQITTPNTLPLAITAFSLNDTTVSTTSTSTTTSSGGTGGCHVAGTMIEMGDGTFKAIENIVAGDVVKAANISGLSLEEDAWHTWSTPDSAFSMTETTATVQSLNVNQFNGWRNINNGLIKLTYEHPLLALQNDKVSYRAAKDVGIGDKIYVKDANGNFNWVEIMTYQVEYADANDHSVLVPVYTIDVETQDSYFADGVVAHNIITGGGGTGKGFEQE